MRIVIIHDTDSNETFVYEDGNEISGGLRKIKFEHEAGKKADLYYGSKKANPLTFFSRFYKTKRAWYINKKMYNLRDDKYNNEYSKY